ncbi:MAG: hypothetical protein ACWGIK_00805 [Achromobacter pulmonis]
MSEVTNKVVFRIDSGKIVNVSAIAHVPIGTPLPEPGDMVTLQPSPEHSGTFTVKSRHFKYGVGVYVAQEIEILVG